MRIAPVDLVAKTEEEVIKWSDIFTRFTHNHPDAMNSAHSVTRAIYWAKTQKDP